MIEESKFHVVVVVGLLAHINAVAARSPCI